MQNPLLQKELQTDNAIELYWMRLYEKKKKL